MEKFWSDRKEHRPAPYTRLGRAFGDLKVRPKLIVLHNLFFLILTCAVYVALIPSFERRVASAKTIEVSLITQIFSEDRPLNDLPKMESYNYLEGSAEKVKVPLDVKDWLDDHPGQVWQNSPQSDFIYRKDPRTGLYRRLTLPNVVYDAVVERAKVALFAVLGLVYLLAVLLLEGIIMPRYVYQPLSVMLAADRATRDGDRSNEMIPDGFIPGDEIGQIMRSRNETVSLLRKREDDLEAQDRLASLGLLSASVAHELNTPLAVLRGSVEKLLESNGTPVTQDRLSRMLRVTERLQSISESLVDFSRLRNTAMEPVKLRPIVEEAWHLVAIDEKAGQVQFANEVGETHTVIGNSDRLIQVFVNLVRNALNVVHEGGHIWVRSSRFTRGSEPWVSITVDDDGPGIPPEVLPDIFGAFVSSRLDARGTGLGLTVAEGIIRQHEGVIHASNRTGGGARLEVILRSAA
jgi:signal transduction histidine kinase